MKELLRKTKELLGRVSGRTLSDLTGAKSVATDIYNQMIEAGATVFEAEQAAQKAEREANQREAFNLSEGQARYDYNPETGQYEMIAQRGKTFAPSSGGTGGTGESPDRMTQYSASKAQNILGFIDQAIDQAGSGAVTGLAGATLGGIPGTQAFNLKRTIDTIKANIGFQELQAMRAASPTGGALGQVAVQELDALQSTLGSLNTSQSRNQLIANLEKIKQHYNNWLSTVNTGTTTAMTPTSNILVSPDITIICHI